MNQKAGFTLLELLVIMTAIALLSTIVFVSIDYARAKSNFAKIVGDLDQLAKAIELYNSSFGKYPVDKTPSNDGSGVSESISDANFDGTAENAPDIIPIYLPSWPKPPCSISDYQYDYDNVCADDNLNMIDCSGNFKYQYVRIALKAPFELNWGGIKIDPWYGHLTKCIYTNIPNNYCGDGLNIETIKNARFVCK